MQILIYILTAFFFVKDRASGKPEKSSKAKQNAGPPQWLLYVAGGVAIWFLYRQYQKQQQQNEIDKVGDTKPVITNNGTVIMLGSAASYAAAIRKALEPINDDEDSLFRTAADAFAAKIPYQALATSYRLQFPKSWENYFNGLSDDLSVDLRSQLTNDEYTKFFNILSGNIPATPVPAPTTSTPNTPPVVQSNVQVVYASSNVNLRNATSPFGVVKTIPKGSKIGQYLGVTRFVANGVTEPGYLIARAENGGPVKRYVVSSRYATLRNA
jgi:hypothetical protein